MEATVIRKICGYVDTYYPGILVSAALVAAFFAFAAPTTPIGGASAAAGPNANSTGCFIDGSYTVRCDLNPNPHYEGVSWPVFTADTPKEVRAEQDRIYGTYESLAGDLSRLDTKYSVQHMRIDTEKYPDVTCFDFYSKGKKHSQTCFDTMEITER